MVRGADGDPVVIRNHPVLHDGTPMPTRYWLVGPAERRAVDRLEAAGGVRWAELEVPAAEVEAAHRIYAEEREAALPPDGRGLRPSGGVAGTRQGVKCLHAHYAWYLAGGPDPVGRWVAGHLTADRPGSAGGDDGRPAAAVDCGTNSTRLLVARPGGPALERLMTITRLGEGVDRSGRLGADAIARTIAVLEDYRRVMDRLEVGVVRMTATSAARDAANREDFFAAAEAAVGVRPELLAGDEEGRLSFAGATAELDPGSGPWLVVDIGGGSTELVAGPAGDGGPTAVRSLDIGCVRLTERFLASDPPRPDEIESARRYVAGLLQQARDDQPELGAGRVMVGLAGTVAALAAIDQELPAYDRDRQHHYVLRRPRVDLMLGRLAATDVSGRRRIPGMEAERAGVIVGGTIVLAETMAAFGFDECLTSEADILDGLVWSTRGGPHLPTV